MCEISSDIIKEILNKSSDINAVKNKEINSPTDSIKILSTDTSYDVFFIDHLLKNKPCVLRNISTDWFVTKTWVRDGSPNFSNIMELYKKIEVTVSDCRKRFYNSQKTENILFESYINYWVNYINVNYSDELPLLYLKDWHLRKHLNEDFYSVPIYFASDWLNEYFSLQTDDDYKFVYMGPKGTWTPFHADVFTSFSWSVNVCGKKRWLLFPPGEENNLRDPLGNLPYDVSICNLNQVKKYEVIQNADEAIFVPSGWYHQVWNMEDTISVNHNWINGCNIKIMWYSIVENLNAVKNEISDCKDMDGWLDHCQIMLKASYGIDFKMFYDLLNFILNRRLDVLNNSVSLKLFNMFTLGKNHAIFDLIQINEVLCLLNNHPDFQLLENIPNKNFDPDFITNMVLKHI